MAGRRDGREEKSQMLMLAGIVIVLAFVTMSVTISEIANLSSGTASVQKEPALISDFRIIKSEIGEVLNSCKNGTVGPVSNATFTKSVLAIQSSFKTLENSKGILFYCHLASNGSSADKNEWDFVTPSTLKYIDIPALSFDGTSDGIIYKGSQSRIVGAVIYIYMSDGKNEIYETVFYNLG